MEAEEIIQVLRLKPLPGEGGYYRETYRSSGIIKEEHLGEEYLGDRNVSTVIYYLVTPDHFSRLHRLPQDEIFHFYLGDEVEIFQIAPGGAWKKLRLGPQITKGQLLQWVVPGGFWQGLRLAPGGRWALLGTTVAPGFDFRDFILADRDPLIREFPQLKDQILLYTLPSM